MMYRNSYEIPDYSFTLLNMLKEQVRFYFHRHHHHPQNFLPSQSELVSLVKHLLVNHPVCRRLLMVGLSTLNLPCLPDHFSPIIWTPLFLSWVLYIKFKNYMWYMQKEIIENSIHRLCSTANILCWGSKKNMWIFKLCQICVFSKCSPCLEKCKKVHIGHSSVLVNWKVLLPK